MATVEQFNRVWTDFTTKCMVAGGRTNEARTETLPLFWNFMTEFEKQFGVTVQRVDSVQQDKEITGDALKALRAWVQRINQSVEEDYLGWCGFT